MAESRTATFESKPALRPMVVVVVGIEVEVVVVVVLMVVGVAGVLVVVTVVDAGRVDALGPAWPPCGADPQPPVTMAVTINIGIDASLVQVTSATPSWPSLAERDRALPEPKYPAFSRGLAWDLLPFKRYGLPFTM